MKNNKKFITPVLVLVFLLPTFGLWQQSKGDTRTSIVSVSPGTAGGKATVKYRVDSAASDFTIVVLPDTQYYSEQSPEIYMTQTKWIRDNRDALNIVFVSHVGDIVQNDDEHESEWQTADAAMGLLEGVVPYGVLPGNHDMQIGGIAKYYEQYFPASRFEKYDWWGGSFDNNRYNYQLFSAGGDDYMIVHMQYCPTNEGIAWANDVLARYPDRKAIVSTHSYIEENGLFVKNCQDKSNGDVNGAKMWNKLIKRNQNVFLVLCGHIPGSAHRQTYEEGRLVDQLLSDYQNIPVSENGYLRIMRFDVQNDVIHVSTYSPYLDRYLENENDRFDLTFDMTGGELPVGKVLVYGGGHYCISTIEQARCELQISEDDPVKAVYLGNLAYKGSLSSLFASAKP
jgi:3',5'-cyclic AMP phosphodiesterase CpdA